MNTTGGIPVIGEGPVPPGWRPWTPSTITPSMGIAVSGEPRRWLTQNVYARLPYPSQLPPRPPLVAGLPMLPLPSSLSLPPFTYVAPPRNLPTLTEFQAWRDQR